MSNTVHIAFVGVALAAIAFVMLFLAVLFDDRLLKTDREIQSWMDMILWCMVGGQLVTAVAVAQTVVQLHH